MTKEITQVDTLTEAQRAKLFEWGENIFGVRAHELTWRHKDVHFLLTVDGELVSHVGVLKHEVSVAGRAVMVGGVGGVVTIPAAQKRGYAVELMRHTAEFFARWDVAAGLLFCLPRRVLLYQSLGWQLLHQPVIIQQPNGSIESPLDVMVLTFGQPWPEGKVELNSLPW
ncbi:MAG TPA: GNAT family N-acetyltransferase [Pyrinomonadaceae bacterium]|nr:GNAT family N-acetyltransferase [Pyrinomonadaceae bacterium]